MRSLSFLLIILVSLFPAGANAFDISADLELELRQFVDDDNKDTFENQRALKAHVEGSESLGSAVEFNFSLNYRYDDQDPDRKFFWSERTAFRVQALNNLWVSFGTEIFSHGYMEVFNPLDIGNAKILDVTPANSEKLGELFLSLQTVLFDGDLTLSFTPRATEPLLPGRDSRLNLPRDLNSVVWLGREGERDHFDDHFILSYEKTFDNFDLLFLTSKGFDRSRFTIGNTDFFDFFGNLIPADGDVFTPYYYERTLTGLTSVYNFDSFQLKFAVAHTHYLATQTVLSARSATDLYLISPRDRTNWTLGIEKDLSFDYGLQGTLFLEYQFIDVDDEDKDNFGLQNDLFIAWRVNFNNVQGSVLTLSALIDVEDKIDEGFLQISYSQRLNNDWKVELNLIDYFIPGGEQVNAISLLRDQESLSFKIKRFF